MLCVLVVTELSTVPRLEVLDIRFTLEVVLVVELNCTLSEAMELLQTLPQLLPWQATQVKLRSWLWINIVG